MRMIIAALLLSMGCSRTDVAGATASAKEFIKNIPNATGVSCTNTDTDNDGYVTCTVFRGTDEPLQIQCGSEKWCLRNCAEGCKYEPIGKIKAKAGQ